MLDRAGTLSARALRGSQRAPKRIARWVAIVIGISLSIGAAPLEDGLVDQLHPKDYIRQLLPKEEALCLIRLYGKESAFNRLAIGNRNGTQQTYGIAQMKNPRVAYLSSIEQVNWGIEYNYDRYGSMCGAWRHFQDKGWH
jgi:hypothetical protein